MIDGQLNPIEKIAKKGRKPHFFELEFGARNTGKVKKSLWIKGKFFNGPRLWRSLAAALQSSNSASGNQNAFRRNHPLRLVSDTAAVRGM
jgi:hypothetical protein